MGTSLLVFSLCVAVLVLHKSAGFISLQRPHILSLYILFMGLMILPLIGGKYNKIISLQPGYNSMCLALSIHLLALTAPFALSDIICCQVIAHSLTR